MRMQTRLADLAPLFLLTILFLLVLSRYAFHDSIHFYLVTDFYPGGDLLGLLGRKDVFNEVGFRPLPK